MELFDNVWASLEWPTVLAALGIFVARVVDMSIGTVRAIYTIRGDKLVSLVLGFTESVIFITAISGVLTGAMSPIKIVAYAGGFACGIMVGLTVEGRIASGWWVVRVIVPDGSNIAQSLRDAGHAVTEVGGRGRDGPVTLLFAVVKRKRAKGLLNLVRKNAPKAVVTVESANSVMNAHAAFGSSKSFRPAPVLTARHNTPHTSPIHKHSEAA